MNHDIYTVKEFFIENSLNQVIIPEIQRDYIWKQENVLNLLSTISEKSKKESPIKKILEENKNLDIQTINVLKKQEQLGRTTSIGFIYAYNDKEIPREYILIDGQQRLTTIFLVLLYLAIKESKINKFRQTYFFDDVLKIDYKVRESAHDFLSNFVNFLLENNNITNLKDQYWYLKEYNYDTTIQTIISNYEIIVDFFITPNNVSYEYIENNVNFWYFDTNVSEQGEELYIYMNSRGEIVSQNENIKANLIKNLGTEDEKHSWGRTWEEWQDFFWKNRKLNADSDLGLDEFLKWITIIEMIKNLEGISVEAIAENIRNVNRSNEIDIKYLNFLIIERYFNAIKKIVELDLINNEYLSFNDKIFSERHDAIEYFRLFPVIMLLAEYEDIDNKCIVRYGRFFENLSRNQNISRIPYNGLVNAVRITNLFISNKYNDVTELICFKGKFNMLLLDEEIIKLQIYQKNPELRNEIEKAFWEAEDYDFCQGSLKFIFRCIGDPIAPDNFNKESLELFNLHYSAFRQLLSGRNDLLRRALLTKGDFKTEKGTTSRWGMDKYSFMHSREEWIKHLTEDKHPLLDSFEKLLTGYIEYKKTYSCENKKEYLNETIDNFEDDKKGWSFYFIKYPEIFNFCKNKVVCFGSDDLTDIVLFSGTNAASNDIELSDFLKKISVIS